MGRITIEDNKQLAVIFPSPEVRRIMGRILEAIEVIDGETIIFRYTNGTSATWPLELIRPVQEEYLKTNYPELYL